MITGLVVNDLAAGISSNISEMVTSLELSWTLDAVSQMRFSVHDPGAQMLRGNYFQVRREITYGSDLFECTTLETSQGDGSAMKLTVEARRASIQKMRRDKTPEAYSGATATDYANIVAQKYGLGFVGQSTAVKGAIVKAATPTQTESSWDVLNRLAGEAKFVVFESNNTLYFASQEWLLGKWGNIDLYWPSVEGSAYYVMETPGCRRSDDDVTAAEAQIVLNRDNAVNLRPGMTINLHGMYEFDLSYLISEVSYDEGDGKPVAIAARTPEKSE